MLTGFASFGEGNFRVNCIRFGRRPRFERLENRELLTTIRVVSPVDDGTQDVGTLSWAIEAANEIWQNNGIVSSQLEAEGVFPVAGGSVDLITQSGDGGINGIAINFNLVDEIFPGTTTIFLTGNLPEITAANLVIDGNLNATGSNAPINPVVINAALHSGTATGIRYNGLAKGAGELTVSNISLSYFDTAPLQITSLSAGDVVTIDNVEVSNSGLATGDPGISFLDTPSGSGYFHIFNSTIKDNGGAGIRVRDSSANVASIANRIVNNTVTNNGLYVGSNPNHDAHVLYAGIVLEKFRRIEISNNVITTAGHAPSIYLQQQLVEVSIAGNSFTTVDVPALFLTPFNTPTNNRYNITGNSFNIAASSSQLVTPYSYSDWSNGGAVTLFNPAGPPTYGLPAPNDTVGWIPNPPTILTNEVSRDAANDWVIPFRTYFDATVDGTTYSAAGDYVFELYKLSGSTWTRVDTQGRTVPAGDFRDSFVVAGSTFNPGDRVSMTATALTGANAGRTTEFAFPSQSTYYTVNVAPRVVDVRFSGVQPNGTPWAPARGPYSIASKVSAGRQTAPIATSGVNKISIEFTEQIRKQIGASTVVALQNNDTDGNAILELYQSKRNPNNGSATTNGRILATGFNYDDVSKTGTWTFPVLEDGKYEIELKSGIGGVADPDASPLDGEWTYNDGGTPDSFNDPGQTFLVGNSTPGSMDYDGDNDQEFRLLFSLLAGDYNGDGIVTNADVPILNDLNTDGNGDGNADTSSGGADYQIRDSNLDDYLPVRKFQGADFNDDENVNSIDLAIWKTSYATAAGAGDATGDDATNGSDFLRWISSQGNWTYWDATPPISTPPAIVGENPVMGLPKVTNVIVSGSNSAHAPFSYASVAGSGAQLASVPVGGADTITIVFSEEVNISSDSLYLFGILNATVPTVVDFSYDASTHSASWRFANWWYADQYMLVLTDDVTDVSGNRLDGEWVNPFTVTTTNAAVSEFPSGNGIAGGGFVFLITRLIGDANHTNVANSADLNIVLANLGMLTGATYSQGDFNGDGDVDNDDLDLVILVWNYSLESANWRRADVNLDGRVDDLDLNIIASNAGMTGAAWEDGDVNFDGQVTMADLDMALTQYGPWWDWYGTVA